MHRRTFILQPLLLSAVHTCHMINTHPARGAADVTLQCCHYNDSSKHCRRGNSRDEEELRSSAATHSTDGLCVCLSNTVSLRSLPVPVHASALRPVDGGGGCEELHPSGERGNMSERWGFSPLRPVIHGGGCRSAPGAHLWFGLLAGRPCNSCQQVTCPPGSQGGEEGSRGGGEAWLFYVLHLTGLACFWDVNTGKTAAALGLLEVVCLPLCLISPQMSLFT